MMPHPNFCEIRNPKGTKYIEKCQFGTLTGGVQRETRTPYSVRNLNPTDTWQATICNTRGGDGLHWVVVLYKDTKCVCIDPLCHWEGKTACGVVTGSPLQKALREKFDTVEEVFSFLQDDGWSCGYQCVYTLTQLFPHDIHGLTLDHIKGGLSPAPKVFINTCLDAIRKEREATTPEVVILDESLDGTSDYSLDEVPDEVSDELSSCDIEEIGEILDGGAILVSQTGVAPTSSVLPDQTDLTQTTSALPGQTDVTPTSSVRPVVLTREALWQFICKERKLNCTAAPPLTQEQRENANSTKSSYSVNFKLALVTFLRVHTVSGELVKTMKDALFGEPEVGMLRTMFYCSLCQNLFVFLFVYFSCIFYSLLCTFFCFGCC